MTRTSLHTLMLKPLACAVAMFEITPRKVVPVAMSMCRRRVAPAGTFVKVHTTFGSAAGQAHVYGNWQRHRHAVPDAHGQARHHFRRCPGHAGAGRVERDRDVT